MKAAWRIVAAIAATYFYFLLFAQFAFLEGLAERSGGEGFLKPVMAAMGAGGLAGSFLAPGLARRWGARGVLRGALGLCGVLAGVSIGLGGMAGGVGVALLMGAALGTATVVLAGSLPGWVAPGRGALVVGMGTGVAYGLCNVPVIFEAGWLEQSWFSVVAAVGGALAVPAEGEWRKREGVSGIEGRRGMVVVLVTLFFLVWFDAAAFYIIQHTEELKKDTWGSGHLWRNAGLHFGAAVLAGWLLDRDWLWRLLFGALGMLSAGALMVNVAEFAGAGGVLYAVGVSLYSVALVAVPGLLSRAGSRETALWRAAGVFAIAGWVGSALGVGMGENLENLERVPVGFVAVAWVVVLAARWWYRARGRADLKVIAGVFGVMGAGWVFTCFAKDDPGVVDSVKRGREVYLSEGCIHCHSRYVRPGTRDVVAWGPEVDAAELVEEEPVLIGNRRQGPDLLQVGLRRSATWLELKLRDPRGLHPESAMPGYGHLFDDGRGADLVAFLGGTREGDFAERLGVIGGWEADVNAEAKDGEELYARRCAMCHGAEGRGDGDLAGKFPRPPTNLVEGPFLHTLGEKGAELRMRVGRVVKFGIPGTDMAGHEVLEDREVAGLAEWVLGLRVDE